MVNKPPSKGLPSEHERIGIGTNVFIYFLEDHSRNGLWCSSLFDQIEGGRNPAVTSTITLLELLVQPYRDQKEERAQKIFALVGPYPNLHWIPVNMEIADHGAQPCARYRLSTPDAIQLATAINYKANRFFRNDRGLRRVQEIQCLILDDVI